MSVQRLWHVRQESVNGRFGAFAQDVGVRGQTVSPTNVERMARDCWLATPQPGGGRVGFAQPML